MKKLFKIIPLLVMPIAFSSCSLLKPLDNTEEQKETANSNFVISAEALSLGFGSTAKLSASMQENGSNVRTTVNWSTSNATVASISKNKTENVGEQVTVTAGNVEGSAVITAKTADGKYTKTCNISVHDVSGTTIMIYMCGANLESGTDDYGQTHVNNAGLASMDLDEILDVDGQPDDVNIVIQTGGAKAWANSAINPNKSQRWEIRNKKLNKVSETAKKNMGLQSTLQDFVTWGLTNYKAEKYGLIMWNHGGAMGGCCFDEQYEQNEDYYISADELYNAVKNARSAAGISSKLEWITYDACLMAVQDIAEYNSYNFNYMLSSQESEAGYGYDYDAWLPTLYNNPGINGGDLLEVIGHTFMVEEKSLFQSWGDPFDQTQSVYDLSKMPAYKTAFESIASDLNSIIGNDSDKAALLGQTIAQAREYGLDNGESSGFEVYDMKEALNKVKANSTFSSISSKVNTFYTALDEMVIYEEHGEDTTGCGICIFSPCYLSVPYSYGGTEYTKSNFTEWKKVSNKIWPELYSNWAD